MFEENLRCYLHYLGGKLFLKNSYRNYIILIILLYFELAYINK
jgi:hypothetical protein